MTGIDTGQTDNGEHQTDGRDPGTDERRDGAAAGRHLDVHRVGIWMVGLGSAAAVVGVLLDAMRHADDPGLAAEEGIFDFSGFAHALFFGGVAVVVLGVLALAVGSRLYRPGPVTLGRRLAQVGVPLVAVVLIGGTAAAAGASRLGEGSEPAAAAEAGTTAEGAATDAAAAGTSTGADHPHEAGAATGHEHGTTGGTTDDATADGAATADGSATADGAAASGSHGDIVEGTATGDSPCEIAQPAPASPGQVGAGEGGSDPIGEHGHRGMVRPVDMTAEERTLLTDQMRQARAVIDEFPTVADAEAGGYHMSTVFVPCIGAHYTNTDRVVGFDPTKPSELLYDGTAPDAKIIGLSYLVWNPGGPPEGFAGENDHWHQHNSNGGLCLAGGVVVGGEEMDEAACVARGGRKTVLEDVWMVHAWVAPGLECSWGVFAGECPELGGRVGGTAWDAPTPEDDKAGETGMLD